MITSCNPYPGEVMSPQDKLSDFETLFSLFDNNYAPLEYKQERYGFNYEELKESYVKIVVVNKQNPYLFDTVLDNLYKTGVVDISIVEDLSEYENDDEELVNEAEDTITILNKYIDGLTLQVKPDKLKSLMKQLYVESLNMEKTE